MKDKEVDKIIDALIQKVEYLNKVMEAQEILNKFRDEHRASK